MKKTLLLFYTIIFTVTVYGIPEVAAEPPGRIYGKVTSGGNPVPFANIGIRHSSRGATTDINGDFAIENLPLGKYDIRVSFIGYKPWEGSAEVSRNNKSVRLDIALTEQPSVLDEVVVTGTRTEKRRIDSAVPVNVLDARVLDATGSQNLSDGLSFQPGIRVEKDCQTCNYTQVRMNGLPGPYSQILINNRPLLSSLAGLYGLEQIPASMIERVEVMKGGGSVLYGSNAVAGTINIITKRPSGTSAEANTNVSWINEGATDFQSGAIGSLSNASGKAGGTVLLSHRDRNAWDANGDGFSELAAMENISLSGSGFIKTGKSSELGFGIHSINEIRNGGDRLDRVPHERLQSEFRDSRIIAANADYRHEFYGKRTVLDIYTGAQQTKRDHYTGAFGADGYGKTNSKTFHAGAQINHTVISFFNTKNVFTLGADFLADDVFDEIKAYNYLIDQKAIQSGVFFQSDWDISAKLNLLTGIRMTHHNKVSDPVFNPAVSILYKPMTGLQLRAGRSTGFRAPQAFDTDMHIAFSGGGISLTQIDPNLRSERSESYTVSADYNKMSKKYIFGFTVGGFYTRINDTFVLVESTDPVVNDQTILIRTNGSNAYVQGITVEGRINGNYLIEGDLGFTLQRSYYDEPVSWSSEIAGSKEMLRTPDAYGYFNVTWSGIRKARISISGVYTGSMMVPHFGGAPGVENDEMINSTPFFELNFKTEYTVPLSRRSSALVLSAGIQNIFNEFQSDFDRGPNRDSNYMYGPGRPRTLFAGAAWKWNAKGD